jgi:hypothetical protein
LKYYTSILLFLFVSFTSLFSFSQEDNQQKISLKDRLFTGGNMGLQIGNPTMIDISPLIGLKITKHARVGIGATYLYYKYTDYNAVYISNIYGGRVFAQHTIWKNIFAHAEYEVLNGEWVSTARYNISSVLVGAGFRQLLFANSYLNLMLLWNLTNTYDSPYTNPVIRAGVTIGL